MQYSNDYWIAFLNNCSKIHGTKYQYIEPDQLVKSTTKITILCSIHGSFAQTINKHTSAKTGCPKCARTLQRLRNSNITQQSVNQLINRWKVSHPQHTYTQVDQNIDVFCQLHGSTIHTRIGSNSNLHPCKRCGQIIRSNKQKVSPDQYTALATSVHSGKYQYSIIDNIIFANCMKHGLFELTGNIKANHINKSSGCRLCATETSRASQSLTLTKFVDRSTLLHGNKYNYDHVQYHNIHTKVSISCPIHGIFEQTPCNHLNGSACPTCSASSPEQIFMQHADLNNVEYQHQKTFSDCINPNTNRRLRFDFYLPVLNILVELDGPQHFKPIQFSSDKNQYAQLAATKYLDDIKTTYAVKHNIVLTRIPYTQFANLPEIVKQLTKH